MSAQPAAPATPYKPSSLRAALYPYRIHCAGLEYIALATSACMAVTDALALHGLRAVSVSPFGSSHKGDKPLQQSQRPHPAFTPHGAHCSVVGRQLQRADANRATGLCFGNSFVQLLIRPFNLLALNRKKRTFTAFVTFCFDARLHRKGNGSAHGECHAACDNQHGATSKGCGRSSRPSDQLNKVGAKVNALVEAFAGRVVPVAVLDIEQQVVGSHFNFSVCAGQAKAASSAEVVAAAVVGAVAAPAFSPRRVHKFSWASCVGNGGWVALSTLARIGKPANCQIGGAS